MKTFPFTKYIAEILGTFTLVLAVSLSLLGKIGALPTPLLAAIVVGIFVYTIGAISGAHLNPAVTIGLWSIKKVKVKEAVLYIISQLIGAVAAMMLLAAFAFDETKVTVQADFLTLCAEIIGTFFLAFGICSVVYGKVADMASGIVIGGSLLLGIVIAAGLGSNGVLNPAVAFGIGSAGPMYLLGPIVGSVAAMQLYRWMAK
ncbi:MAG: aquaporin [Candidatus Peribacteraceae bacterium]|nr:aquaporin [Candidatus Peribacteraceae bacterium]